MAHWCEAVLGTIRLLPVTCYLLPAIVATVQRSTKDLKIAIAPRYWKFFRVKRMYHRGCCNLRLSPVEQAGTGSLMKMRPAEEWRSSGADQLVSCLQLLRRKKVLLVNMYTDCTILVYTVQ